MNLGELKLALTRFPDDMNDSEIIFSYMTGNGHEYDNLAFVAYAEMPGKTCLVLGSSAVAIDKIKKGTLRYADGRKPTDEGFDVNETT